MAAGVELSEKRLKQMLERRRFQTDAAIVDLDQSNVGRAQARHQLDRAAVWRELERVGKQVDEDRAQLVGVDFKNAQIVGRPDLELEPPGMQERPDLIGDSLDHLGQ